MDVKSIILKEIKPSDIVLDVGCGILQWLGNCKPPGTAYLGIDAYYPYLEHVSGEIATVQGELPDILTVFPSCSYDIILLSDVLEHLETRDAESLLSEVKRICRRNIILIGPEGFLKQDAYDAWGMGLNYFQKHLSGWSQFDLEEQGFEITDRWEQSGGPMLKAVYTI